MPTNFPRNQGRTQRTAAERHQRNRRDTYRDYVGRTVQISSKAKQEKPFRMMGRTAQQIVVFDGSTAIAPGHGREGDASRLLHLYGDPAILNDAD
jgi:hypothetical protein